MPIWICKEGSSNKTWSYEIKGNNVLVKWGRVGLGGQEQRQEFNDAGARDRFIAKKVREKEEKGYKLSTPVEIAEEKKIADELGHQHKIARMQWVSKKGSKLRFIGAYDPAQYVYVEILNSWSKDVVRLLLSKTESFYVEGVAEYSRTIEFQNIRPAGGGFVSGVRTALKRMAQKVAVVVQKFASVGARVLSLTDDEEETTSSAPAEVLEALKGEAIGSQVISKFCGLGVRALDL